MDQNQINENQSALSNTSDNNFQNTKSESLDQAPFQQAAQINSDIQNTPTSDPFFEEYQSPVYAAELTAVKKRFNPLAVIIPVLAVIIAAVVLFVLFFNKTDYKKSEKKYFENLFSAALSSVEEQEKNPNPQKLSVNFKSSLSNLIGSIPDISDIDFISEAAVKDGNIFCTSSFKMGDIDLSGEYWFNNVKKYALLGFPKISDIYLKADANETVNTVADASEFIRVFGEVTEKTSDTYFELIGNVTVEENQALEAGIKTYTADKAEIHLNSQQIAKIFKAFYNNLLESEDAVKLLCDTFGCKNKEELKDAIDGYINFDALDKAENGEEFPWTLDMTVYLKNKEIIGRSIDIEDKDMTYGVEFYNIPTENGSVKFISSSKNDKYLFSILNEDTEKNDIHNGTAEIKVMNYEAALSYKDFAVSNTLFQGKAELSIKNSPAFNASLELKAEESTKNAVITVPNIFTLTIKAEPSVLEYKDEPQLPDSSLAVMGNDGSVNGNEKLNEFMKDIFEYINPFTGYGDLGDLLNYKFNMLDD